MSEPQAINSVYSIEIEKIDPNPDQPRKYFSDESLADLAESIRRYGVMQPITVFRRENETASGISTRYEIIAGERRWRASIKAGMSTIPAIIHEGQDNEQDRFELSILENLQREDLNPVDKARSFARLADEFGMKHAEIADRLGKSREYVSNALRILVLPENVLEALSEGKISEGHTRPLLSLKDREKELQMVFTELIRRSLTVRETESLVRKTNTGISKPRYSGRSTTDLDPEMQELQNRLAGALGTSVSIDTKEEGGKLTIDFFSPEDLKKILALVDTTPFAQDPNNEVEAPAENVFVQNKVDRVSIDFGEDFAAYVKEASKKEPVEMVNKKESAPTMDSDKNIAVGSNLDSHNAVGDKQHVSVENVLQQSKHIGLDRDEALQDQDTTTRTGDFDFSPQGGEAFGPNESLKGEAFVSQGAKETPELHHSIQIDTGALAHVEQGPQNETGTPVEHFSVPDHSNATGERTNFATNDYTEESVAVEAAASPLSASQSSLGGQTAAKATHPMDGFISQPEWQAKQPQSELVGGGSEFLPPESVANPTEPILEYQTSNLVEMGTNGDVVFDQQESQEHKPSNDQSKTSSEKHSGGDPYRLDNFSI